MNAAQKLAAFVVGLAVVFAAAVFVGRAVGPDVRQAPAHDAAHTAHDADYTLELSNDLLNAAADVPMRFRILDTAGTPVTRYVKNHEKLMHFIAVRSDLTGFQHVHPTLQADGTWRVPVDFSAAGDYRVFADFTPEGREGQTLAANVHVGGAYKPLPLPPVAATSAVDGYTVTLRGSAEVNEPSTLTMTVTRDGKPVTDLQPYLGAYGHLVALRAADLEYLHVHPMGEPGDGITASGPDIGFHTTFPSAGNYRLFVDFQHASVVRTAAFTVSVDGGEAS
jgi:hypothetical protein